MTESVHRAGYLEADARATQAYRYPCSRGCSLSARWIDSVASAARSARG